jgi:uncharacterized protein YcnI
MTCLFNTLTAATLWLATGSAALAHVTLEQPQAAAGSTTKAVLRVGHGCDGSATHTLSVLLPAGFAGAKPVPKAGWALTVRKAALAQPRDSHGHSITEDVVEITWTARGRDNWLEDAYYDEFTLRGQLPAQAGPLWFKVSQLCETGRADWADIPATGTSTQGMKTPAVLLQVTPAGATAPHH